MFKILFLQRYCGLGDHNTQYQILDRLSFRDFLGIQTASDVPDEKTVWKYREALTRSGAYEMELAGNIDTDKMPAPSFMAVVVGVGKYAYRRKDGVYVIPVGCLKD